MNLNTSAVVIADSKNMISGKRLTTFEITLPKVLLAEFNTHRMLSRNFQSSRAIPVAKLASIPSFYPEYWGKNQPGMEAKQEEIDDTTAAHVIWMEAIAYCKEASEKLAALGLHKQWSARLQDWHMIAKGVVSSTEWDNFFKLRTHHSAQPEFRQLALKMQYAMENSHPEPMNDGEWHTPYVKSVFNSDWNRRVYLNPEDLMPIDADVAVKISASCCAQVSYRNNDSSQDKALAIYERLISSVPAHLSPVEHQGVVLWNSKPEDKSGNFCGWVQNRKLLEATFSQ